MIPRIESKEPAKSKLDGGKRMDRRIRYGRMANSIDPRVPERYSPDLRVSRAAEREIRVAVS